MLSLLRSLARGISRMNPARLLVLGYLSYIAVGWILLALPFSRTGGFSLMRTMFTTVSAVSTTGLVTENIGESYNFFGQLVILALIQFSGIGFMTFGSCVALARGTRLSEARQEVGRAIFAIPEGFRIDKFLKSVVVFTVIIEGLGALLLFFAFRSNGMAEPLWAAIFHSVSAFCTAGFSLYGTNLEIFHNNVPVNLVIGVLSYLGAIGFIVFVDVWRCLTGKIERITLTSRIILWATFWIGLVGILLFFVTEPSIAGLPADQRLLAAFFQAVSAMTTAGYNTIPMGALSNATIFLLLLMMVVGGSPAGTGGGLKTTTFTALFGIARSAILNRAKVTFWNKEIPEARLRLATASICFYLATLTIGVYLLTLTDRLGFEKLAFEAVSALSTVGLSTGITALLSPLGQLVIMGMMFAGRVGPLAFGVALLTPPRRPDRRPEDLAI